jgi:Response regulator containing a CheY-like receiver domain and an HTH DNA-binding domain
MRKKHITVCVYARDDFTADFIKNFLLTNPHIKIVDNLWASDAVIIQTDLLTPAEKKILQALAQFGSIPKVAAATNYSPGAVKVYLSRIYRKLKVKTAPQAIAVAFSLGLIRPLADS